MQSLNTGRYRAARYELCTFLESVTNLAVYTSLLLSLVQELATTPDNCRALVCFGCTHYTMVPLAAS